MLVNQHLPLIGGEMLSDLAFSSWSVDSSSLFTDLEELTPPPPFYLFFYLFCDVNLSR